MGRVENIAVGNQAAQRELCMLSEHMQSLEAESKRYEMLNSGQKRARNKTTAEKVGHLMFRKSEALSNHHSKRVSMMPSAAAIPNPKQAANHDD